MDATYILTTSTRWDNTERWSINTHDNIINLDAAATCQPPKNTRPITYLQTDTHIEILSTQEDEETHATAMEDTVAIEHPQQHQSMAWEQVNTRKAHQYQGKPATQEAGKTQTRTQGRYEALQEEIQNMEEDKEAGRDTPTHQPRRDSTRNGSQGLHVGRKSSREQAGKRRQQQMAATSQVQPAHTQEVNSQQLPLPTSTNAEPPPPPPPPQKTQTHHNYQPHDHQILPTRHY